MADVKNVKKATKKKSVKRFEKKVPLFQAGELQYGFYEYKMNPECAYDILHDPLTGKKVPGDDAVLLCDYVNTQYGLKGTCVSVLVG